MAFKILYILLSFNILFTQNYINPGVYDQDLIVFLENNYKTSSTLGYNNARDIMYSEIDIKSGNQLTGVYCGYTITLDLNQDFDLNNLNFNYILIDSVLYVHSLF